MAKLLQNHIDELVSQQQELMELEKDIDESKAVIAGKKADISLAVVIKLLKDVKSTFDDMIEQQHGTKHFDEALGSKLASAIEGLSRIQPRVEFNPHILVDVKPIAGQIKDQNDRILELLGKMTDQQAQTNDPLYQIIRAMVERNNAFIEKQIQQYDYTKEFKAIAEAIPRRITEWDIIGSREPNGQIRITATAKKSE